MSIFNAIKNFITNKDDDDDGDYSDEDFDTLKSNIRAKKEKEAAAKKQLEAKNKKDPDLSENIFLNGLKCNDRNISSIGFDNVQNLCAIGLSNGVFKIIGKNGITATFNSTAVTYNSPIKKLIFLINTPFIISISDYSVEKWNYCDNKLVNLLNFKSRITAIGFINSNKFLYIADESGIIQIYNPISHFLSSYTITPELVGLKSVFKDKEQTQNSVFPTCIKISPNDKNLLLIGYSSGLIICWNTELRKIERQFIVPTEKDTYVTTLCWSRHGNKFVVGYLSGTIHMFFYSKPQLGPVLVYSTNSDPNNNEHKPIDSLEWLYTRGKKVLLFKGNYYSSESKSLILIKGDNFKDFSKLSKIEVATNITTFVPVTSLPYMNNGDLLSVLAVDDKGQIFDFKFDPQSTLFTPSNEINRINQITNIHTPDNPVILMDCYSCDPTLLETLLDSSMPYTIPSMKDCSVNGGLHFESYKKCMSSVKVLITLHQDHSIKFWDITNPISIIFLVSTKLRSPEQSAVPIALSFSPKSYLLSISYSNGSLFLYSISDISKRVAKLFVDLQDQPSKDLTNINNNSNNNNNQTKTSQDNIECQDNGNPFLENNDPDSLNPFIESNNQKEQDQKPSTPRSTQQQQEQQQELPDPVPAGCQEFVEIKFSYPIKEIKLSPFKSSCSTSVFLGGTNGKVYHFLVTIQDNKIRDNVTLSSKIIYFARLELLGSVLLPPSSANTTNDNFNSVTTISLCYTSLRTNEDISIIHVGTNDGWIFLIDLSNYKILSSFKISSKSTPIKILYYLTKSGEIPLYIFFDMEKLDLNLEKLQPIPLPDNNNNNHNNNNNIHSFIEDTVLLVSTDQEISLFNVPLLSIARNTSFDHQKIVSRNDFSGQILNTSLTTFIDGRISIFDSNGNFYQLSTINLDKITKISTKPISNSCQLVTAIQNTIFVYNNNHLYTLCPSHSLKNNPSSLFLDNIQLPQEPKQQTSISNFFFSKQPTNLDQTFSDGIAVPNPRTISAKGDTTKIYASDLFDSLNQMKQALQQRGERLNELQEKTERMENESNQFREMTKQLAQNSKSFF
eukprot:gene9383-11528_t